MQANYEHMRLVTITSWPVSVKSRHLPVLRVGIFRIVSLLVHLQFLPSTPLRVTPHTASTWCTEYQSNCIDLCPDHSSLHRYDSPRRPLPRGCQRFRYSTLDLLTGFSFTYSNHRDIHMFPDMYS